MEDQLSSEVLDPLRLAEPLWALIRLGEADTDEVGVVAGGDTP
jgi:hypothetical protein